MVDHTFDMDPASRIASPTRREAAVAHPCAHSQTSILTPGESDAFPPDESSHWNLRTRLGLLVGLTAASWGLVGSIAFLLLHR